MTLPETVASAPARPSRPTPPGARVAPTASIPLAGALASLARVPVVFAFPPALGLALAIVFGLAGCGGAGSDPAPGSEGGEAATEGQVEPVTVRAARVERRDLRPSIELAGTLVAIPERTAEITARIEAPILEVLVADGEEVREGQILVRLDDRVAKARLASASATREEREAALERWKKGPLAGEIEAARQETLRLEAVLRARRARAKALASLGEKEDVSPVAREEADAQAAAAEAELASAREKWKLLEAGTRAEVLREAEARLVAARAEEEAARLELEYTRVESPLAGTVSRLVARRGAMATASAPLVTVIDRSRLFARVALPAARLADVEIGAEAEVAVAGEPAAKGTRPAKLARLGGAADASTGSVTAFLVLSNPGGRLRPNQACSARILLAERSGALAIPLEALADRDGTPVVTVIRADRASEVAVRVGVATRDWIEITGGLEEGDLVATEGGYGLPDGCPVRVAAAGGGAAAEAEPPEEGKATAGAPGP